MMGDDPSASGDPRDRTFRQALTDALPRLEAAVAERLTYVISVWQQIEPRVRAFVADGDTLSEQDWQDQPEATHALYVKMKGLLAEYDAERAQQQDGEEGA